MFAAVHRTNDCVVSMNAFLLNIFEAHTFTLFYRIAKSCPFNSGWTQDHGRSLPLRLSFCSSCARIPVCSTKERSLWDEMLRWRFVIDVNELLGTIYNNVGSLQRDKKQGDPYGCLRRIVYDGKTYILFL